ncbi:MAG: bifunctional proline dehydrogenase/L-glutamate gamma-semialdehyde dehydrogenase PutA [Rhizobiaceae bacterium]|nr:bifunctional proline dehydrogenase/L-glutamate gamma-semialdehyde dehydrogenase PutA [Rhizobiaceae bacterium]
MTASQLNDTAPDEAEMLRAALRAATWADETASIRALADGLGWTPDLAALVSEQAAEAVRRLRERHAPGLMESLLAEYGLNTDEGVALMCLAEAYLRTPDAATLDALITDKIGDADWSRHLGRAESALVNTSTWALMLTGRVYKQIPAEASDLGSVMRGVVRRLGEPVVRSAVAQAMKMLGTQFVLGSTIEEALENAKADRQKGNVLHSFDMLGEAARTGEDAERYFRSYAKAIAAIGGHALADDPHGNSGISVKLSALHPRYEALQADRVLSELVPRIVSLARQAKAANIALAIDAEEADRLDLSLDVIEALLTDPSLSGWDGLGIVVQAYARRTPLLIDWLHEMAKAHDRRFSVRLVKGAYWDSEVKHAQVNGLPGYPVWTRKEHTDTAYLACARKLLAMTDRIYPQFATHNAHTTVAIEAMAQGISPAPRFEFQRLHGMGGPLHEMLQQADRRLRRIYAPVGVHRDLLAYLVRRLLENGANSSFVHQIVDASVPPESIAADPVAKARMQGFAPHPAIPSPATLYGGRANSRGWTMNDTASRTALMAAARPHLQRKPDPAPGAAVTNPADASDVVGHSRAASPAEVTAAINTARAALERWAATSAADRAAILEKAATLLEAATGELVALAIREAGKSWADAVAELREAVDFLTYYAAEARKLPAGATPRGVIAAISPWNFPLAIFTGQVSAALAAGNAVVAKPAEQTPLIARRAVALLHEAGVPEGVLRLVEGDGATGAALTRDPLISGTLFTGSNDTARAIDMAMAGQGSPEALLVAETGGLNAMIVDSTALLEQAVRDILASAFQSAGQRCSALRLLCVQADIAKPLIAMLKGAMDELRIGDPANPANDIGPVIDREAQAGIVAHLAEMERQGRILHRLKLPAEAARGTFVAPHLVRLDRVSDLKREIFGPILHVVTFKARDLEKLVGEINATGYGLTFGMHSRIDARVDAICNAVHAGNIYVNRNQIGAVVGVQPFGGDGLSGTGPKAGGPLYLRRLVHLANDAAPPMPLGATELLGPTGERNTYILAPRAHVLCLGPDFEAQAARVRSVGATPIIADPAADNFAVFTAGAHTGIALYGGTDWRAVRMALASLPGARIVLEREDCPVERLWSEKSVSEDTTASGGNASLLAAVA